MNDHGMVNKYTINKNHLQEEADVYQVQLKNRFESLADTFNTESYIEDIAIGTVETSECVAGKQSKATKDKLTTGTKQLMQKRRDIHRLQKQLDESQPIEQAGFRSGYSTIDHIHSIKLIS